MEAYAPGVLEQVREESIRRLENGGLPVLAERRLAALFGSSGERFTTELSVSEFALAQSTGLRPVSQVMGSCVYYALVAPEALSPSDTAERGKALQEADVAWAWNTSRDRALERMRAEARSCGADAVVGVGIRQTHKRITPGDFDASVEYTATGTAVVHSSPTGRPGPVLTSLSAQDYWKLLQQGFAAVGVVAHTAVVACVPSVKAGRAEASGVLSSAGRESWEIAEFSEGLRLVHATAFAQMRAQAGLMGAEGIVGVTVEREQFASEVTNNGYKDLILVVHAIGTAVTRGGTAPSGSPLTITPVRHLDEKGGTGP
jgi:uncharacterized protein YbjQ (UPF0145 family)